MVNALIKGIFYVITMICSALLSPLINLISSLLPSLGTAINNATTYLQTIVAGIPLCLNLLMIPRDAVIFLFDYYIIKYTIYIGVRAVRCAISVYNKIKP